MSEDNVVDWAATEETYDLDEGGGARTEVGTVEVGVSKGDSDNIAGDGEVVTMMAAVGGATISPATPAGEIRGWNCPTLVFVALMVAVGGFKILPAPPAGDICG